MNIINNYMEILLFFFNKKKLDHEEKIGFKAINGPLACIY